MVPKAASPNCPLKNPKKPTNQLNKQKNQLRNGGEMNINLRVAISCCQHLGLEKKFINYKMCGLQLRIIIRSFHSFIIKGLP